MREIYREGAVGALMDEYERAVWELRRLIEQIAEDDALRIIDPKTKDEDCRSVQTVVSHVVNSGYSYADYLRRQFGVPSSRPPRTLLSQGEFGERLDAMLAYTVETLEGRWRMTDEELAGVAIKTSWGVTYDVEQLLEHAVVHVLRHRRQIEKFIRQGLIPAAP